jgi:hypothetical protein
METDKKTPQDPKASRDYRDIGFTCPMCKGKGHLTPEEHKAWAEALIMIFMPYKLFSRKRTETP